MSSLLSYIYKQLRFSYLGNNEKIKQILIKSLKKFKYIKKRTVWNHEIDFF